MTCMLVRVRECRQVPDHLLLLCFFLFKQKTAYEMRISDWSSDVCSSDLLALVALASLPGVVSGAESASAAAANGVIVVLVALGLLIAFGGIGASMQLDRARGRSEEHTSELQSLMRSSYAVFCLKKKKKQ